MKVLIYDNWAEGAYVYRHIRDALEPAGATIELFHIAGLTDSSAPSKSAVEEIPALDVSAFENRTLEAILGYFQPDVVIGFNLCSLFDRAMLLTARRLGIPTVYLQHGALLGDHESHAMNQQIDSNRGVRDYVERIPKYATVLPWYIRASRASGDPPAWRRVIWRAIASPAVNAYEPLAPKELWPSRALVYVRQDAEVLRRDYGIPESRIAIVGNPELDAAFERRSHPLSSRERAELCRKHGLDERAPILFVADEEIDRYGLFGRTLEFGRMWMRELSAACRAVRFQILYRPKRADTGAWPAVEGVRVVTTREPSVADSIALSTAALGLLSTVYQTAVVLDRPILAPLWHLNGASREMSPYLKYNAAVRVETAADLPAALERAAAGDCTTDNRAFVKRFIEEGAGSSKRLIREAVCSVLPVACTA